MDDYFHRENAISACYILWEREAATASRDPVGEEQSSSLPLGESGRSREGPRALASRRRPMPAIVWQIDNPDDAATVAAVSLAGWVLVFTSTLLINHFELFGLQQVTDNLANRAMPAPTFKWAMPLAAVR